MKAYAEGGGAQRRGARGACGRAKSRGGQDQEKQPAHRASGEEWSEKETWGKHWDIVVDASEPSHEPKPRQTPQQQHTSPQPPEAARGPVSCPELGPKEQSIGASPFPFVQAEAEVDVSSQSGCQA